MQQLYFHNISPVAFSIFGFDIYWYSFAYVVGILLGYLIIKRYNKSINLLSKKALDDLIMYVVLGIIIGARLGNSLFYDLGDTLNNPIKIFMTRDGGMSFHGGLIGLVIAIFLFCKRHNVSFWHMVDMVSIVAPIGLLLGRVANFVNGELWGKIAESSIPWAVIFPKAGYEPRHPSQLYEAIGEGVVLFIILNYLFNFTKIKEYPGMISGLFLILYGIMRMYIENYREPDYMVGLLSIGQVLCLPMVAIGAIIVYAMLTKVQHRAGD